MGLPEAPRTVSVRLRSCYLALPKRHNFLLGFEAAIWHCRGATTCFYCASKLPSGTFSAPLKSLKSLKSLKTLPAAFDGVSLLCHATSRGATNCFCSSSKLLSGTSEAPQPVYYWGFEAAIWHFRGATTCFYWGFETAIWHVSSTP